MRRVFSVSVYIKQSDHVLLIEHKRHGLWLPIGGELHYAFTRLPDITAETPQECARRKVREETGWGPDVVTFPRILPERIGEPLGFLGYEEHESGDRGLHMNFVFVANLPPGDHVPKSDGSWSDYTWVDKERFERNPVHVPPNVRQVLERIL